MMFTEGDTITTETIRAVLISLTYVLRDLPAYKRADKDLISAQIAKLLQVLRARDEAGDRSAGRAIREFKTWIKTVPLSDVN